MKKLATLITVGLALGVGFSLGTDPVLAEVPGAVETVTSAPAAPAAVEDPAWLTIVLALIVPVMSLVSTLVPSGGPIMRIVDALAFNWGRARNDPRAQ